MATSFTALLVVLALAMPVAASAQFMDPVLEQYAPSSQQVDKKVKGDKGDGGDGVEGDAPAGQGVAVGGTGQGADGNTDDGSGNDAGAAGGGSGGGSGGGGGDTGGSAGGGADGAPGGDAAGTQSGAGDSGLGARLLADVPVTWFDFLAFALAAAALIGTALLLRRLSRSPAEG